MSNFVLYPNYYFFSLRICQCSSKRSYFKDKYSISDSLHELFCFMLSIVILMPILFLLMLFYQFHNAYNYVKFFCEHFYYPAMKWIVSCLSLEKYFLQHFLIFDDSFYNSNVQSGHKLCYSGYKNMFLVIGLAKYKFQSFLISLLHLHDST